jgi:hypothetical protein
MPRRKRTDDAPAASIAPVAEAPDTAVIEEPEIVGDGDSAADPLFGGPVPDPVIEDAPAKTKWLRVALDKDGRVDPERLSDSQRKALGLSDSSGVPVEMSVSREECIVVLGVVSFIGSVIYSRAAGVPLDQARRDMALTDAEVEAATPSLSRVLSKRLPSWLAEWKDEIALVSILGVIYAQKIGAAAAARGGDPK